MSTLSTGEKYPGVKLPNWDLVFQRHWQGTYKFANGDCYIGPFSNGKREGHGIFIFSSGNKEEGEWKDCKQIGIHIYTFKDDSTKKRQHPSLNWVDWSSSVSLLLMLLPQRPSISSYNRSPRRLCTIILISCLTWDRGFRHEVTCHKAIQILLFFPCDPKRSLVYQSW